MSNNNAASRASVSPTLHFEEAMRAGVALVRFERLVAQELARFDFQACNTRTAVEGGKAYH